jgi:hypothetical protein
MASGQLDLDHRGRSARFRCHVGRAWQKQRNEPRLRWLHCRTLLIKRISPPAKQKARVKTVTTRHRRHSRSCLASLGDDRTLLLARP